MKKNISTILLSMVFCYIAIYTAAYPRETFSAAADAVNLWFNVVFPSLLPFFICIEILIGLGIVSLVGSTFKPVMSTVFNVPGEGSFGFFMSIASGYPVGAKIVSKFRQKDICTAQEGQRLLNLCSTSGPLFIIGAVATGIMKNPEIGFLLALSHYLSAVTVGFFMRFYRRDKVSKRIAIRTNPLSDMLEYRRKDGRSIGLLLGDAVKNSINLILMIGGFIIFFAVIARVLQISGLLPFLSRAVASAIPFFKVDPQIISGLFIGILEVTNGIKECAALQIPTLNKIVIASFMMGFGGLSVNAQVLSVISETDLKFGIYFIFKVVQGIFASAYSYVLFNHFGTAEVFNEYSSSGFAQWKQFSLRYWDELFLSSSMNLILMLVFILIVVIVYHTIYSFQRIPRKN